MNYITTNIRISEEDYLRLKTEAAKSRKSLSAVIREKLQPNQEKKELSSVAKAKAKKLMQELDELAKKNAKYFKGIDGVRIIREMRYENS